MIKTNVEAIPEPTSHSAVLPAEGYDQRTCVLKPRREEIDPLLNSHAAFGGAERTSALECQLDPRRRLTDTQLEEKMAQSHLPVEQRRRQFVTAATRVIIQEGLAKATTRRIAEEAGLPAPNLHYCFETKEDLLQAVYEHAASSAFAEIGSSVTPGVGLAQGIEDIMRSYVQWNRGNPQVQLAMLELTFWSLRNPTSSHLAGRVYRRYLSGFEQLLVEVMTPDEADVDLDTLAQLLIGAIDGFTMQRLTLKDKVGEAFFNMSVRALQAAVGATAVARS
ncbi:TetR/AcrR family transcriptional regulator [Paenarthrobacter sp. NPDC058040]|uniref:TetR/AcrR family transcriptional regulator n=1 Tax=unclassified Paenarthrobacter TaxID=2634190 RepID=UPI0036DB0897